MILGKSRMGKESEVDMLALLGLPWAWVDTHPRAQVGPQRLTTPSFLGLPSLVLPSSPASVVSRTGLGIFQLRTSSANSVSICHGWPFFSKDTCAPSPMPPSSLTCQVGFTAMPSSFPNFRTIDKTTATLLIDSLLI